MDATGKSIESKIKTVEERLQKLRNVESGLRSFDAFQSNTDLKDIVERNLQVAIETCLDIGKIVISRKKLAEPKDNKGIFVILAEAGVINQQSLSFMIPMAGTRNILVHGYDKVDDSLVYGILKKHLDDFNTFLRQIRDNYLRGPNGA
ncbi:MAG: DUF86 domain-containing protein [Deltaproteobacteria bacterium]|nr:DUF86 domain-containing protein [Deltaproteobacteria bacterium]